MGNLEKKFLQALVDSHWPVSVYLVNGINLRGLLTQVEDNALWLVNENQEQMVFKSAISTIVPNPRP